MTTSASSLGASNTKVATLFLILVLFIGCFIQSAYASLEYEKRLIDSLSQYQSGDEADVEAALRRYVRDYPNSQVAQLLLADLLAARSGIVSPDTQYQSQFDNRTAHIQLDGLRDEINLRWNQIAESNPAKAGLVPAAILKLDIKHKTIIFVDTEAARLYVFKNNDGILKHVTDYYTTIGLQGTHKRKEGDERTPIGVYHVTSFIHDKELPPLYGTGAFPINYPNELDRRYKRTGYGIWIHGTHPESFNRVPYASNGCVALSNPEFTSLRSVIDHTRKTPVIISDEVSWVNNDNTKYAGDLLVSTLYAWQKDWESMDVERYLSHYSKRKYQSESGQTYTTWAARKKQVGLAKTRIKVGIDAVSAYLYPGEEDMLVVEFTQDYQSNNFDSTAHKKQYWIKDSEDNWKIIYEGSQ